MSAEPGGGGFEVEIAEELPGFCCMVVSGQGVWAAFKDEPGGHRFQRIPPTERNGRVQTSTVTVAVLPEPEGGGTQAIPDLELEWFTTRSGAKGGQHVNKTESCVQLRHVPTRIMVRCETERSQYRNRQTALRILKAKLAQLKNDADHAATAGQRKAQVGSGMRGDKAWTIRVKDGVVTHHATGKKYRYEDYIKGDY